MVRQRQESIELYKQGNRPELVEKEQAEIDLIERYMPKKLTEAEQADGHRQGDRRYRRREHQGHGARSWPRSKEGYAGRMDFSKVGPALKAKLGG